MTGRTNYTAPTTGQLPNGPAQIEDVYEHFDALLGEVVPLPEDLPDPVDSWEGREVTVASTRLVYRFLSSEWRVVAGQVSASRSKATNQSIPDGSWTSVLWPTEVEPAAGGLAYASATGVFTVPVRGRYLVAAQLAFQTTGSPANQRTIRVRTSSGDTRQSFQLIPQSSQYPPTPSIATVVELNAGDTIWVEAFQSQGSDQNAGISAVSSFITIDRI